MSQWRRRTIHVLLALILLLLLVLFNEARADDVDAWRRHRFQEQQQQLLLDEADYVNTVDEPLSDLPRLFDVPDSVYYNTLDNEIDDYLDDDVVVDEDGVEYEARVASSEFEDLYPRPEFSGLPHCQDATDDDKSR